MQTKFVSSDIFFYCSWRKIQPSKFWKFFSVCRNTRCRLPSTPSCLKRIFYSQNQTYRITWSREKRFGRSCWLVSRDLNINYRNCLFILIVSLRFLRRIFWERTEYLFTRLSDVRRFSQNLASVKHWATSIAQFSMFLAFLQCTYQWVSTTRDCPLVFR